jgi:hypothetical protein
MIANKQAAETALAALNRAYAELERSIVEVNASATPDEAGVYRHLVGELFYSIIFKLLEPNYEQHPDLKPDSWDEE